MEQVFKSNYGTCSSLEPRGAEVPFGSIGRWPKECFGIFEFCQISNPRCQDFVSQWPLPGRRPTVRHGSQWAIKVLWAICRYRGVQQKARRRMRGAWPAAHHVLVGDLEQRAADSARGHRDAGHHRHVLVAGLPWDCVRLGTRLTTLFQA